MGTATDAILVYGYDLGDEFTHVTPEPDSMPWYTQDEDDEDYNLAEQATLWLCRAAGLIALPGDADYEVLRTAAQKRTGVEIIVHAHADAPMYLLAATGSVHRAHRSQPVNVDPAFATDFLTVAHYRAALTTACRTLGITPVADGRPVPPRWLLCSYWSPA